MDVGMVGVTAMFDGTQIVVRVNHSFGKQKSSRQLTIGSRCAHDDRKRFSMQADFERFLRRGNVLRRAAGATAEPDHLNTTEGRE